ncbi:MAG TPA: hypothetical protein VFE51_11610 [Verrucomicrobiae bacterium]|nr:hypothetical protein [Verrucomicrobiae bacterium]
MNPQVSNGSAVLFATAHEPKELTIGVIGRDPMIDRLATATMGLLTELNCDSAVRVLKAQQGVGSALVDHMDKKKPRWSPEEVEKLLLTHASTLNYLLGERADLQKKIARIDYAIQLVTDIERQLVEVKGLTYSGWCAARTREALKKAREQLTETRKHIAATPTR